MNTISIAYDSVGTGHETLVGEVSRLIGEVVLNDVQAEAEGHRGMMCSGTLKVLTEMAAEDVQEVLDDVASDYMANGLFLWAQA